MDRFDRLPISKQGPSVPGQIGRDNAISQAYKMRQKKAPFEAAHPGGVHAKDRAPFTRTGLIEENAVSFDDQIAPANFARLIAGIIHAEKPQNASTRSARTKNQSLIIEPHAFVE